MNIRVEGLTQKNIYSVIISDIDMIGEDGKEMRMHPELTVKNLDNNNTFIGVIISIDILRVTQLKKVSLKSQFDYRIQSKNNYLFSENGKSLWIDILTEIYRNQCDMMIAYINTHLLGTGMDFSGYKKIEVCRENIKALLNSPNS